MNAIKILIIDDDAIDRANYKRILTKYFVDAFETFEAINSREAIQILKTKSIDCILLDYQLPDTNGIELLKIIKKTFEKFIPVIMLTGQGSEDVAVQSIKAGAADYISKNKIDAVLLIKIIKNAIKNSKLKKIINEQKNKLAYYAYADGLTGLVNRHTFDEITAQSLLDAKQLNHDLAIILIDIDNFMAINDAIGYLAGNEILIEVSKKLIALLPKNVVIARYGDDEFAILIKKTKIDIIHLAVLARNIIAKISEPYQLATDEFYTNVTASIGIVCYPDSGNELNELLRNVNIALGQAKAKGGNFFEFYSEESNKVYQNNLDLEKALYNALTRPANKEFFMLYQPVYELKYKKIIGFEAMPYWQHPKLGVIAPEQFMAIADKANLNILIGKWMLDIIAQEFPGMRFPGFIDPFFIMDINLSPMQLENFLIANSLEKLLANTEMPPQSISLEIKEGTIADYFQDPIKIKNLHGISIQLLINDFQIGFHALEKISHLPVTSLKLNPAFIRNIGHGKPYDTIIKTLVNLAKELNLKIIIKGVETESQYEFLLDLGYSYAQGDYFCKPLTANEIKALK